MSLSFSSSSLACLTDLKFDSWTIFYDTIYACQDREDDKRVGIKSTAVLFGTRVRPILTAFAAAFAACLVLSGAMLGLGPAYSLLACGGTLAHLGWQLWAWNDKSVRDSMLKFEVSVLRRSASLCGF